MMKKHHLKYFFIVTFLSVILNNAKAASYYWIASISSNWNVATNWSLTDAGASAGVVPGVNDVAIFKSRLGNCTINVNVNIKGIDVQSAYTGTITQSTYSIAIGTSSAIFAGGTFLGGSGTITINGTSTFSGGTFNAPSLLVIANNFSKGAGNTFNHNNGEIKFISTLTISGNTTFNNLTFDGAAPGKTFTLSGTTSLTALGKLTLSNNGITLNTGEINVKGNIYLLHTAIAGSTIIKINGTNNTQNIYGGANIGSGGLPAVIINKTGASSNLVLHNTVNFTSNFTFTQCPIFTTTGSTVVFYGSGSISTKNISGKFSLNNLILYSINNSSYNLGATDTIKVNGTLRTGGNGQTAINVGVIEAKGDLQLDNIFGSAGSGTILFSGVGDQTIIGSGSVGIGSIPQVKINKPSGKLILKNYINVYTNWTNVSGIVECYDNSTELVFYWPGTIKEPNPLSNLTLRYSGINFNFTIDPLVPLTITNNLKLKSTGTFGYLKLQSGTINCAGNLINENLFDGGGTGVIKLNGALDQNVTSTARSTKGNLCKLIIDKPSGTLTLNNSLTFNASFIYEKGNVVCNSDTTTFNFENTGVNYDLIDLEGATTKMALKGVILNTSKTLAGEMNLNGFLNIAATKTLTAAGKTINLKGNWNNAGTFVHGNNKVIFSGNSNQTIDNNVGEFSCIEMNKTNKLNIGTGFTNLIVIKDSLNLKKGIFDAATKEINLKDNAIVKFGSDSSFVEGKISKTGNDAFAFPLGNSSIAAGKYHPLSITAPSNTTDKFCAKYFYANQGFGITSSDSLASVTNCEYWELQQTTGTSNVKVSLGWNINNNNCTIQNFLASRIAFFDGTKWQNLGKESLSTTTFGGNIKASIANNFTVNRPLLFASKNQLFLNLQNIYSSAFDITAPGVSLLNANKTNEFIIEPTISNTPSNNIVQIKNFDASEPAEHQFSMQFRYDNKYNVYDVKYAVDNGTQYPLDSSFFEVNTIKPTKISFYEEKPEKIDIIFTTNLVNDLYLNESSLNLNLINAANYPTKNLKILNNQNIILLNASSTSWSTYGQSSGLYKYIFDLTDSLGVSESFEGFFVIN
jgi:hypothetical protein